MNAEEGGAAHVRYRVLSEVVASYPGLLRTTDRLVEDLCNPHIPQAVLLDELRSHGLKNFGLHNQHEKGPEAVWAISSAFLEGLESRDPAVRQTSLDSLLWYLEKILMDSGRDLQRYASVLSESFEKLAGLPEEQFLRLISNPRQLKKFAQLLLEQGCLGVDPAPLGTLFSKALQTTYEYWLAREDPLVWFLRLLPEPGIPSEVEEVSALLYPVSHDNLRALVHQLGYARSADPWEQLRALAGMPGYRQIVQFYDDIGSRLGQTTLLRRFPFLKIAYLAKVLGTEGLTGVHENALREMSRSLSEFLRTKPNGMVQPSLSDALGAMRSSLHEYPETTLYCIQTVGNHVIATGDSNLAEWFFQKIISLGFQCPAIQGVTHDWQVRVSKAHLKNIRVWLELIENKPKWSKSLLSALVINLRLGGVHISDTDLFQKDITKLLNSDIKPVYYLVKQLARLFPVYFNEVNAEGALRDVSTEIDEMSGRADPLVHFLRKQIHVECSARVIGFIEASIVFWRTGDKRVLAQFLPEDLFERIPAAGEFVDELSAIFNTISRERGFTAVRDLLTLAPDDIVPLIDTVPSVSAFERKRAALAVRLYLLLHDKYSLSPRAVAQQLRYARHIGLPAADEVLAALEDGTVTERLEVILAYLSQLKEIILSPEQFQAVEDVFKKRHIAAGIASMYGRYLERKFDALSLTLKLENLANALFDEVVAAANIQFVTRGTLFKIKKSMDLFSQALDLEGIFSNRLATSIELLGGALEVRRFSSSQYVDIFRGFSEAVQDIMNAYCTGIHKSNLKRIILQLGRDRILPKYVNHSQDDSDFEFINRVSEQFLRETVATSFGFQQLDTFVSRILRKLLEQTQGLDVQTLDLLMSYDPKRAISSIHHPNRTTEDRIHLGNKGFNLVKLAEFSVPVPPGFIITTEVFRCLQAIRSFTYAFDHLHASVREEMAKLEEATGQRYGDADNPLVVSVRSGASISMPGMLTSLLDVGLNPQTVQGLIQQTGRPWFAWDSYRRFLQSWGMSFGLSRDVFDAVIDLYKKKHAVGVKVQFSPEQMKDVAMAYRFVIRELGIPLIDDPYQQLEMAISQVFQSWFSKKAQTYREILGISDSWGTAVIVQCMAYGNLDTDAGTGVLFTRNPREAGDRVMLWGDFAMSAQGEDIVSGLVQTLPLSKEQRLLEERTLDVSLEETFPEIHGALLAIAKDLIYEKRWGAQEIEFTFEGREAGSLSVLQTRDMAVTRKESLLAFHPSPELTACLLSSGIGAGGGVLSGRAVFELDDIAALREQEPETPLILIRSDTVPDDIRHISAADGLLTARGGATSHAAIVANRLGKTCVVGCSKLIVWEHEKKCRLNDRQISLGDFLSIDGRSGSIYFGRHEIREIRASAEYCFL